MRARKSIADTLSVAVAILGIVSIFSVLTFGQNASPQTASTKPTRIVDDWTHHHVVFSNPGSLADAMRNGTVDKWTRIVNDPRYQLQQIKRSGPTPVPFPTPPPLPFPFPGKGTPLKKDWSTGMGGIAASLTGIVGTLGSSSISGSSTLLVDGVTFHASPPTAASNNTGTFTGNPTNGQTVTIGGSEVLTASLSTAASQTGTFASPPTTGSAITVVNGSNTLTLTTNATAANAIGTFAAPPSTSTTISITSGSNTLTLTNNGTKASVTGTAAGAITGTVVLNSGLGNTLTLTPGGTGTLTFGGAAALNDTVTIGGTTYTWHTTSITNVGSVLHGSSASDSAGNLRAAINNVASQCVNPAGSGCFNVSAANASATATVSGAVTTVTNTTAGSINFSATTTNGTVVTLSPSGGTIPAGSDSCSSSTAGTFISNSTANTEAGHVNSAINACNTSYSAVGFTSTVAGAVVTVNAVNPGAATFTNGTNFTWSASSSGSNGTNACSISTTGTFATGASTTILAQNLQAAINACPAAAGVGAMQSTNTVTAATTTPGNFTTFSVGATNNTGIFTWGTVTAGTLGSTACTSSTTGTFATSSSTTTLASNLSAAINACPTGTGLTNTSTTNGSGGVTVTASTWGTSSITLTPTSGFFAWNAGNLSGGTNGTNTGTSFAIDNVLADNATNLAAAITRNGGTVGVTASSGGTAVVTVTAATAGTGANGITLAKTLSNFTFTGNLAGGTDGTTSGTANPPTFAYWSVNNYVSPTILATNIATAINANTTLQTVSTGVWAVANSPSDDDVTIVARASGANSYAVTPSSFSAFSGGTLSGGATGTGTVQPNAYPAKYGASLTAASCSGDFVVYPTGKAGSAGSASIIAYNNLYTTGCSGTVPLVYWAYNTGGTVTTSPVLSLDGTELAFVQVSGTTASLVLLKWTSSTTESAIAPMTLTSVATGSAYQTCTAPCMYTMTFSGSHNDTLSAPYYYYDGDILYVGDDSGNLHQFTGIFNGAPAENTTSPWPVLLSATNKLASPVFDPNWVSGGQVFVGDLGGVAHCVTASTGAIFGTTSALGGAIADAPLIDSSANYVIVFVASDAVVGFSEQFFPGGQGGPVGVGTGGTGYYIYAGTFDNVYYQSSNRTGSIYVVGNTGVTTGATLYQVGLSGGFLTGGATAVVTALTPNATNAYPWPSPAGEFCNNGTSACALQTASGCGWTNGNANITCTTASFTSNEVGASVYGTNIPSGATIATWVSSTHITISPTPTVSGSSASLTIGATGAGTDYVFFSVNRGNKTGCTNTAGNGCILSYNVSNPFAVAISGSGLNVTTPGTNGCWATGGLVIDNSVPTGTLAGASQVYFVNLSGAAAGNPTTQTSSNCSPGTATLSATQAAQANP